MAFDHFSEKHCAPKLFNLLRINVNILFTEKSRWYFLNEMEKQTSYIWYNLLILAHSRTSSLRPPLLIVQIELWKYTLTTKRARVSFFFFLLYFSHFTCLLDWSIWALDGMRSHCRNAARKIGLIIIQITTVFCGSFWIIYIISLRYLVKCDGKVQENELGKNMHSNCLFRKISYINR